MKGLVVLLTVASAINIDKDSQKALGIGSNKEDVWVPFMTEPHGLKYFNPIQDKIVDTIPAGEKKAPTALMQTAISSPHAPWDGHCAPKCTWECKKIECEKECKPKCGLPKCQTRCRDPDMSQCKIQCDQQPHCATFCPPQRVCEKAANGTRVCHDPDCATKCEKPQCHMFCGNNGAQVCENVCAEPKCDWTCSDPKTCPKPECCLKCNKQNCANRMTSFAMPALGPGEKIVAEYEAKAPGKWSTGPWSACDCKSGKQYRQVKCDNPLNTCGLAETPETSKSCEIPCKGHYEFAQWSDCKGECWSEGYQYREGRCILGTCGGQHTTRELRKCRYDAERCHTCQVTLYGGTCLDDGDTDCKDGWSATFGMGTYEEREMREHNARPLDTSSVKVMGFCCAARLYQYSNRNRQERDGAAWEVTFPEGIYGKRALEERGAFNDEASSLQVFQDQHCIEATRMLHGSKRKANAAAATLSLAALAVLAAF